MHKADFSNPSSDNWRRVLTKGRFIPPKIDRAADEIFSKDARQLLRAMDRYDSWLAHPIELLMMFNSQSTNIA